MDVHPSRELVASGQKAGRDRKSQAHVRIWSTESLQTLYVFGMGELDTGVTAVAFSQLVRLFKFNSTGQQDFHKTLSERRQLYSCRGQWPGEHPVRLAVAMGPPVGQSCRKLLKIYIPL